MQKRKGSNSALEREINSQNRLSRSSGVRGLLPSFLLERTSIGNTRLLELTQYLKFIINLHHLMAIAGSACLYTATRSRRSPVPRCSAIFLMNRGFYLAISGPLAWASNNFANHCRMSIALGCMIVMTESRSILSTWLSRVHEAPAYKTGYSVVIDLSALWTVVSVSLRRYHFVRLNKPCLCFTPTRLGGPRRSFHVYHLIAENFVFSSSRKMFVDRIVYTIRLHEPVDADTTLCDIRMSLLRSSLFR